MESKYDRLREELDTLGYRQKLLPECIPLVDRLLADLKITTTNLQKYMKISQHALEERDRLELGAEPYKCDNAKLIKECNDLHIAFINFKDQHEKIQRDLRSQISVLQFRLDNCNSEKNNIMSQLQQLEKQKIRGASKSGLSKQKKSVEISTAVTNAQEIIAKLKKDFTELRDKHERIVEENVALHNQLATRDEEMKRLRALLEGGRPYEAASKDCCYRNVDKQVSVLQEEIIKLKNEKNDFLVQMKAKLSEAVAKQHEAMRRALHLVERNRQLEKEMRDIDEIALAVETECNNTVKDNTEKVTRLQDRINESLLMIQNLERDNVKLKQTKLELSADLDAVKLEKIHLQKQLDSETEDKKRLTDKINNFTIIEKDLNLEIDRLTKLTAQQKRKIVELESQLSCDNVTKDQIDGYQQVQFDQEESEMSDKISQTVSKKGKFKHKTEHKKNCKKSGKSKTISRTPTDGPSYPYDVETSQKCCCESGTCMKNLKDLLDKEMEYRQTQALHTLNTLKQEKEYYMKEYHKALEQIRNIPSAEKSDNTKTQEIYQELVDCRQQLKEKGVLIKELENEINQIKSAGIRDQGFSRNDTVCNNPNCKRKEREMDIKTNELKHIEVENNALKTKLQTLNETTLFNEERMKKAFKEMEEHIRKLEDERRDLVKSELTQRSNVNQLEADYSNIKEQLKQTQNELNNQKANYNQLKLLHEQTDRALSEAQVQIVRAETELVNYQSKAKESTRDNVTYDRELALLNSDIKIMRSQISKLDKEKDDLLNQLDEKTEKIASLEDQLNTKTKTVNKLETELKELKRKLSKYADETSSQDQIIRSARQEMTGLEQDYEKEKRLKEAAISENKRLQNDLATVTCDCRNARKELELSNRQVEDLKRQLQHYIAEVRRTEDLISNKELERNELLDQFRCLSQEANILENNNHTLENEATQSRVQLSVALDHSSELERKLENQESIIRSYEKQISELTTQVASLEVQLKQTNREYEQYNNEMKQMRDLCVKLDKEKDNLQNQLYRKDDSKAKVDRTTDKLLSEKEALQRALEKERHSLESVEKLLNEARQEVIEQRLLNQDIQAEVSKLKERISELQEKLNITNEQLDIYQGKALEYSQLNKHLRREIANERFSKARSDDKAHYPSLKHSEKPEHQNMKLSGTSLNPPSKNPRTITLSVPDKSKVNTHSQPTLSPPLSRGHSALSTKTLQASRKYHGSDDSIHGTIDLTKLYQDNTTECDDHCNRVRCPNYKKKNFSEAYSDDEFIKKQRRKDNEQPGVSRKDVVGLKIAEDFTNKNSSRDPVVTVVENGDKAWKEMRGKESKISGEMIDHNADKKSVFSTKSLEQKNYYHGSDGIIHGVIDLKKLWYTEKKEINSSERRKNKNKLDPVSREEKEIVNSTKKESPDIDRGRNRHSNALDKRGIINLNYSNTSAGTNGKNNPRINEGQISSKNHRKLENSSAKVKNDSQHINKNDKIKCQPKNYASDNKFAGTKRHTSPKSFSFDGSSLSRKNPFNYENISTSHVSTLPSTSKEYFPIDEKESKICPPKALAYDIPWGNCKCRECYSNMSKSESDIRRKCMERGLSATNRCDKRNIKDNKIVKTSKRLSEKIDKQVKNEATFNMITKTNPTTISSNNEKKQTSAKSIQETGKDTKATCTQSNINVEADFSQNSDDSAVFRKVFSIDGVGLQCHCCISSFKAQTKN